MHIDILEPHYSYFDEEEQPLHLVWNQKTIYYKNIKICLSKTPYLKSPLTGKIYFPVVTAVLIEEECAKAIHSNFSEIRINKFGFFNRIKFPIANNINLLYSAVEHHFIPGLFNPPPPSNGYLTPVYFSSKVLTKYMHHNDYNSHFASDSFGTIKFLKEGVQIPFGKNIKGNVIMWLGDILKLSVYEQSYLLTENIEPQFDIHSDFYRNQICNEWI